MTKDDPINYFGKIPHKFYLKTKFNLAEVIFKLLHSYCLSYQFFFFFQIEETCTFMNISRLKYHLSVI